MILLLFLVFCDQFCDLSRCGAGYTILRVVFLNVGNMGHKHTFLRTFSVLVYLSDSVLFFGIW